MQTIFVSGGISDFFCLVIAYWVGGYIQIFGLTHLKKYIYMLCILSIWEVIFSVYFLDSLSIKTGKMFYAAHSNYYTQTRESFFAFCIALGLFVFFSSFKPRTNSLINIVAKSSLSVYVLHEGVIKELWFNQWFHFKDFVLLDSTKIYLCKLLIVPIIFYVISIFIDLIYYKTLFIPINHINQKIFKDQKKINYIPH
jgi:hypothetical protein